MLNDLAVYVYEPFAEWTEQVTQWGATIVSTPEEAIGDCMMEAQRTVAEQIEDFRSNRIGKDVSRTGQILPVWICQRPL